MSSFAIMWAPIVFGFALFLGTGLLFMIQPPVGKALLPHLGGAALAWSVCLVFFQAALMAGCIYADLLHRFRGVRWQPWLQVLLLAAALILCFTGLCGDEMLNELLPRLTSFVDWPIVSALAVLIVTVGVPYVALAAVVPLVQRWFAHLDHPKASDPYFLLVASNLGGLAAVVLYIALLESNTLLAAQWMSWRLAASALGVFVLLAALCVWRSPRNPELEPANPAHPNEPLIPRLIGRGEATWPRRLYWLTASALPAGLLLGVTELLTVEIAPTPVLWAVPLALYLLAFAQAFGRVAPYESGTKSRRLIMQMAWWLAFGIAALVVGSNARPGRDGLEFGHGVLFLLLLFAPSRWLGVLQPLWVLLTVFLQTILFGETAITSGMISLHLICFYLSARICFAQLAEDRPAATALTTYHAWIGIGGLCGGLFQLLIAPLIFQMARFEFFFLAALATTLRPAWLSNGLTDWLVCRLFAPKETPGTWRDKAALVFDVGLALLVAGGAFGLFLRSQREILSIEGPLQATFGATLLLMARPLRFGLALAGIVLVGLIGQDAHRHNRMRDDLITRQRTPFGILRVEEAERPINRPRRPVAGAAFLVPEIEMGGSYTERTLTQSNAVRATCITGPEVFRRYATGQYHRRGPVGEVMQRLSWFAPPRPMEPVEGGGRRMQIAHVDHGYWLGTGRDNAVGDARMLASLIGLGAAPGLTPSHLTINALWTEPPYAVVGLGVGALYTYAHPGQWVDAYELDPAIIAYSQDTPPVFHYLQSAQARGVQGKIFPGDPRRSMAQPGREGFYQVIFLDAWQGNAVPTHLLTREAIERYFQKLAPEGLLCIHATNRYLDLRLVAKARELSIRIARAAHGDVEPPGYVDSVWILLARNDAIMRKWEKNGEFHAPDMGEERPRLGRREFWTDERQDVFAAVPRNRVWPTLVYWMLGLCFFAGVLLGFAETVLALQGRANTP